MEKSEKITTLTKSLLIFDAEVSKINKGETNPFFKNRYASLPDILSAIKEPLKVAGLTVKQFPEGIDGLTTIVFHAESGEFISSTYSMKSVKDDPQQQGSRITYQRRYALGAVLGLNIDIDDDRNQANSAGSGTPAKKPISESQYKAVVERLKNGIDCLEATIKAFVLSETQLEVLTDLQTKYCNE